MRHFVVAALVSAVSSRMRLNEIRLADHQFDENSNDNDPFEDEDSIATFPLEEDVDDFDENFVTPELDESVATMNELSSAVGASVDADEQNIVLMSPAVKKLVEGFKTSLIGMMTPEEVPHLSEALPFLFVAGIVSSDPHLRAHLFQAGIPQYLLYDVLKSILTNGLFLNEKKESLRIVVMSVVVSFTLLGAPSHSLRGNLFMAALFAGFLDMLKRWIKQQDFFE